MQRLVAMNSEEIEDTIIAVKAAHAMANRHKKDMAILFDYSIVPLDENDEPPLEIVEVQISSVERTCPPLAGFFLRVWYM